MTYITLCEEAGEPTDNIRAALDYVIREGETMLAEKPPANAAQIVADARRKLAHLTSQ